MPDAAAAPPSSTRYLHAYPIGKKIIYFVRDCYEDCYEECYAEILSATASGKTLINDTGTSKLGKSVFYIYVLQRYPGGTR